MSNKIQKLMDEVYDFWQKEENKYKSKNEILSTFPTKNRVAVRFGNLNYQVGNGGFGQWALVNSYYNDDIDELLEFVDIGVEKNIEGFELIKDIIYEVHADVLDYEDFVDCYHCGGTGDDPYKTDETDTRCEVCAGVRQFQNEDDPESFERLDNMYRENREKILNSVTNLILAL